MRDVPASSRNRAFSLLEVIIALFLLSFAALSVLSMTQTGFVAQKRNEEIAKANLVLASVIADLRIWGENITNYKGSWATYNTTFIATGYPGYKVTARALHTGRPIQSPCAELEDQWEPTTQGARTMPNAIVPVELTASWSSDPLDSVTVLTYVGEPKRDITNIRFQVNGPSPVSVSVGGTSEYTISARDQSNVGLDNLMFQWIPDVRYLKPTPNAKRDGRYFEMERLPDPPLPDLPPPAPPARSPVACYARYAGTILDASAGGVELP